MRFSEFIGLAASIASTQAALQGFNYGATKSDGSFQEQSDYEALFKRAQSLPGTSGFTSARLYTMIQGGTTDTPSSAFQAAMDTKTSLLLGIWCSAGQDIVTNELNALKSAIQQYGSDFTSLIVGISVGSEDLYRVSPTGIENDSGYGATPDELVSYIKQTRDAISGTGASGASIGHVDTWTAWVNGSNSAVTEAVDWVGMDTYPYFQTTVENSIENANQTFWDAYDATAGAAGGKEVWIAETGWPVSGKTENLAVPSTQNAEIYWQDVACSLLGKYPTYWYTIQDANPTTPNPSFGIIGADINSAPLYDLTCKKQPASSSGSGSKTSSSTTSAASGKSPSATGNPAGSNNGVGGGSSASSGSGDTAPTGSAKASVTGAVATATASSGTAASSAAAGGASASASGPAAAQTATGGAGKVDAAVGAGILAIVGLVAAL